MERREKREGIKRGDMRRYEKLNQREEIRERKRGEIN